MLVETARAFNRTATSGECPLRPLPLLQQPAAGAAAAIVLNPAGFPATANALKAMTGPQLTALLTVSPLIAFTFVSPAPFLNLKTKNYNFWLCLLNRHLKQLNSVTINMHLKTRDLKQAS